jgi:hypothetical protein
MTTEEAIKLVEELNLNLDFLHAGCMPGVVNTANTIATESKAQIRKLREFLRTRTVTVITMYRGHDAEVLVQVVEGRLTDEQKRAWRDAHGCDLPGEEDSDDDVNNMFFREFDAPVPNDQAADLFNADGETYANTSLPQNPNLKDLLFYSQGRNAPTLPRRTKDEP